MNTSEAATLLALARYAVISPLVSRTWVDKDPEYYRELHRITHTRHRFPGDVEKAVPERTMRRWISWYRVGRVVGGHALPPGVDALRPIERSDTGKPRVLNPAVLDRAVELRKEEPQRTTRSLIELLQAEAKAHNETLEPIEESTLDYHLRARRATRKVLKQDTQVYPRYQHSHRNDCLQGDMTGSFFLPHPQDPQKTRQCFLHAFICDATRRVSGEFYFRQNLPCLSDCFRKTILQFGLPSQVYWDYVKLNIIPVMLRPSLCLDGPKALVRWTSRCTRTQHNQRDWSQLRMSGEVFQEGRS